MSKFQRSDMDAARDELMSHVHRCGVLKASPEQQEAWMEDTIGFMAERFPSLAAEDLDELYAIGLRFCQPVISNRVQDEAPAAQDDVEEQALAGAL